MSSIEDVWAHLSQVAVLQWKSESRTLTGWNGTGSGLVRVSSPAFDVLIFDESGAWRQSGGSQIHFLNCFRWTKIDNRLSLEHLRFGIEKPVFLFEMAPDEAGIWRDINPHPCRDDFYSATLTMDASRLFLDWSVQGRKRDESIRSIYF